MSSIFTPKEVVGGDTVLLVKWIVEDGAKVSAGTVIAEVETIKATFSVESPQNGYLYQLVAEGAYFDIKTPIADVVAEKEIEGRQKFVSSDLKAMPQQIITQKAEKLIKEHHLPLSLFQDKQVVREKDVLAHISGKKEDIPFWGKEPLDLNHDWDQILQSQEYVNLKKLLDKIRQRMKAKFNRHVPTGDLLYDRWELARNFGFGEGASIYDNSLILGNPKIGKNCWIGPFTVIDSFHAPLEIGDYTSIGAGSQIYTHNTINYALTGGQAEVYKNPVKIGQCCFIAPEVVIAPGTQIGDHSFVAAGSYVQGSFSDYSFISGNPARKMGRIEIVQNKVNLIKDSAF